MLKGKTRNLPRGGAIALLLILALMLSALCACIYVRQVKVESPVLEYNGKGIPLSFYELMLSRMKGTLARNRYDVYNLEIGTTYYWRVRNPREESEVFSFTTEDAAPRFMFFDGTTNARDLGGYVTEDGNRIKQGLMYRGAELDMHMNLSDEGRKTMHDLLGIKCDIDFRGEAVGFSTKSVIGDDVNFVQVRLCAYEEYIKE